MTAKHAVGISGLLLIVGVAGRLFVHIPNVTPVTAIALFISAYVGVRYAVPVIIGTMLVSDMIIGFYAWPVMLAVYGSFIIAGVLGMVLQKKRTIGRVSLTTLSASLLFFIITNWAVWQFSSMYQHSFTGLMQSYMLAIPFLKYSLGGDILYTSLFFGIYEFTAVVTRKHINRLNEYGKIWT